MKITKILSYTALLALNFCNIPMLYGSSHDPSYDRVFYDSMTPSDIDDFLCGTTTQEPQNCENISQITKDKTDIKKDITLSKSFSPKIALRAQLGQTLKKSHADLEESRKSTTPEQQKQIHESQLILSNAYKNTSTSEKIKNEKSQKSSAAISDQKPTRSCTPPKSQIAYFREDLTPVSQRRYDLVASRDLQVKKQGYITQNAIELYSSPKTDEDDGESSEEIMRDIAYISFSFIAPSCKSRVIDTPIIAPIMPFTDPQIVLQDKLIPIFELHHKYDASLEPKYKTTNLRFLKK